MVVTSFWKEKYVVESKKNWDLFYKRNGVRFFRDRYWTLNETSEDGFYDLLKSWTHLAESEGRALYMLEVGCGVGNTLFPILSLNNSIYFYACDISEEAVRLLQDNPAFDCKRIHCFVSDVSKEPLKNHVPLEAQLDVAILFFSLSAMTPTQHKIVIENICSVLRPGGWILFRDFCKGDLAEKRFSKENQLEDQWFVRQDGTFSYFFRIDQVQELFESQGMNTENLKTVERRIENRKLGKKMERRWLQGCFQKKVSV
ncbi:Methyltransferase-like protein 6 [Galdieria sulphuraria]|nr:Methyltransferase-like protein 6 [Galdieria sulphuraria]